MTSPSGVRASLAWLLVALSPLCFAEKSATPSTKAVKWLQVRGILDPAGVWVMLINAQRAQASDGNLCRKSVLVALDPKESYEDIYAAKVQDDGKLFGKIVKIVTVKRETVKLVYRVDVPAYVDEGCWCDDPNAGLAVLAPGKAVAYIANTQRGTLPRRLCTQPTAGMAVEMRPRREVPVVVWTADQGDLPSMAKDDIANADWGYNKGLAGITLRPVFREIKPAEMRPALPQCFPNADETACCDAIVNSAYYVQGSLNVYYGFGNGNFTCRGGPDGAAASFIHDVPILGDAAHELGHALGLFQRDSEPDATVKYRTGHTSNAPKFACENVMWEGTHYLKDELSPGQAFWMSLSSTSFVTQNAASLNCSSTANSPSPCPLFSLGHEGAFQPVCTLKPAEAPRTLVILRHREPHFTCDLPSTTFANGHDIEVALSARYDELKSHVRGREDLQLGVHTKAHFLKHWENDVALDATDLIAPGSKNTNKLLSTMLPSRLRKRVSAKDLEEARSRACQAPVQPNSSVR